MLNLGPFRSFIAVAETGGIRAAGRRLDLAPSVVAEHLAQIEKALGAKLVLRRPQGVSLLPSGDALLPVARALIETSVRAREVVSGQGIALAASSNAGIYMLMPALAAFERETGVRIDLWVGPNPKVRERLLAGRAVIGVMEWWEPEPGFEARPWREEPLLLITAPDHPWARNGPVRRDDLAAEDVLGGEPGSGTGRVLRAALGPLVDGLRLRGGFNSTEAVKQGVRAGLGVSFVLAASVRDDLEAGTLAAPMLEGPPLGKTLWLVEAEGIVEDSPAMKLRMVLESRT